MATLRPAIDVSVGRVRGRVERMDPALVGKEEEPSAERGKSESLCCGEHCITMQKQLG